MGVELIQCAANAPEQRFRWHEAGALACAGKPFRRRYPVQVSSEELRAAALALSRQERAELAEELLSSLDESDQDVEAAWAAEIIRRARELADGTVEPVDWEVAKEQIARRLRERREASASSRG